ncbi:ATP-dependent RNA helicase HrpB [Vibrio sinaloensis DSM 21326]|uniref:ATP-dependent RNA helicase HrpB n=1 Tax=Vibrio sinaloensis DSM 21326 TaxID=945550 RepID=E8M1R1_PHOS4|nr:ATP-dependent helicase HrpB [Vibrio sinaloensis]EGA72048.1 ATP-dependent RNA helicase HrpB [Vibrio sinaloensis DSM 21326]
MSQLPIEGVIPELLSGVRDDNQLILKAAPGAGKSTYFPLQLVKQNVVTGKVIMLEPRRLAARNIACYLANQLGEPVGQRIGYRVRGESKVSSQTQLEIVTEGVLTRMIQSDPELNGIDLVIFDEFHERSIHADTALAFCLEIQEALRDDLKLVVMSATLDQQALCRLLPEARYVESQGRSYPVEHRYLPAKANQSIEDLLTQQIKYLMSNEPGSLLAFLPGVAAIKRVEEKLSDFADDIEVCPLYGQLSFSQQQKAIQPADEGKRKIVLATNIAETSLTIEGIRLVVDSGLERIAKFDLKSGVTRLEQGRIARSSAEQRAGRAGRTEPGICVRLYSGNQLQQQPHVPAAEILHSDLASLALELIQWGAQDVADLKWLDLPPQSALNQAHALLRSLKLIDKKSQLTSAGKLAIQLGVEPRMAAMLAFAQTKQMAAAACCVVALLENPERNQIDFSHCVHRFVAKRHSKQAMVMQRAQQLAKKLACSIECQTLDSSDVALLLAVAFPDRVAQMRHQQAGRFRLANGHGAQLADDEVLASSAYLVVIDLMRSQAESSRIFSVIELDIAHLESVYGELFSLDERVDWDESKGRLIAEEQKRLGELVVEKKALPEPSKEKMTQALLNFVRRKGLSVLQWSAQSEDTLQRLRCAAEWLPEKPWPNLAEQGLLDALELWLEPYLSGVHSVKGLAKVDLNAALMAYVGWPLNQEIDQWLPVSYQLPTGTKKKIRYQQGQEPMLSVRMQEVFGEHTSPQIALGRKTVVLELLSPAQRPLQVTRDLASFWAGAYKEVQKEMKGRYPKHVWPDDPANHIATTKTKRHFNQ